MQTSLKNEKYEVNAHLYTENGDWGVEFCVRKNCSDIGFGWHYSAFTGILGLYLPFIIINIHIPFYIADDGD